ncbi:MAG: hypothetical protein IM638_08815 [Bacteroidetes bacterium]|nr:hypothetical protein [Bacteroidota bacterium]
MNEAALQEKNRSRIKTKGTEKENKILPEKIGGVAGWRSPKNKNSVVLNIFLLLFG